MDSYYLVDPKMRHGCLFVDFWNVPRETLERLVEDVVIGPTCHKSLTVLFQKPQTAKEKIQRIVSETGAKDMREERHGRPLR